MCSDRSWRTEEAFLGAALAGRVSSVWDEAEVRFGHVSGTADQK